MTVTRQPKLVCSLLSGVFQQGSIVKLAVRMLVILTALKYCWLAWHEKRHRHFAATIVSPFEAQSTYPPKFCRFNIDTRTGACIRALVRHLHSRLRHPRPGKPLVTRLSKLIKIQMQCKLRLRLTKARCDLPACLVAALLFDDEPLVLANMSFF